MENKETKPTSRSFRSRLYDLPTGVFEGKVIKKGDTWIYVEGFNFDDEKAPARFLIATKKGGTVEILIDNIYRFKCGISANVDYATGKPKAVFILKTFKLLAE